ncbi:Tet(A)/Tet(B)/Tet(C) family tetracycline efflux MFS transporter [Paludisphaera borealis]|uniref:Tetracycline resistance protein, class C n=1 Tax=Paludisphaera borealis TaxID=1387353 RepID=A0A1U7CM46_9BACT|nr:Tet(A)/Tet(B)/Tet(C) family tetracycline efflux MFS transporter [Paludisphaera borealis]APW59989.1 Tetracycline resistance protein, class C [Paludisphaera borealis]
MNPRKSVGRPLLVILATVTLDSVGLGLVLPVLPSLIRELTHTTDVAGHFGYFLAAYALMQFLFSPILGALSDRYGRRPVLLVSLAGAAVDYTVMAFTTSLPILYLGRIVAGITGANMAVATAYLADISDESERAQRYGYMNACFGIGFVAGPLLGGVVGAISPRYPFLAAAVFNGLNFLLGWFVLPESHLAEKQPLHITHLNPFRSLWWVFGIKAILPLLLVYSVISCVAQVPATIWVIYGEDRYAWGTRMVGLTFAVFGVMYGLSQAFLTGWMSKRWGDRRSLLLALIADNLGFVGMALATQGWMVFPVMILLAAGGIAMPALQALLSKQVDEGKQGELQGTLVSVMSLASIVGPVVVTTVYAQTSGLWPGFVWICGAVVYLLCFPALGFEFALAARRNGPETPVEA